MFCVIHDLQVTFSEEDLPRDPGEYILGYYSNNTNSIVGVTEPFQVHTALTQLHSHLISNANISLHAHLSSSEHVVGQDD